MPSFLLGRKKLPSISSLVVFVVRNFRIVGCFFLLFYFLNDNGKKRRKKIETMYVYSVVSSAL